MIDIISFMIFIPALILMWAISPFTICLTIGFIHIAIKEGW